MAGAAYMAHARQYYQSSEVNNIRYGLEPLVAGYGVEEAAEFGPLKLKTIRNQLIGSDLARSTINKRIGMIKRAFKWAVSEQLISPMVYQGLAAVENLKEGRSAARETRPIQPVPAEFVRAVLPYTSKTVAAMIELQMLTGMRSGELVIMRPADIDCSGDIWFYRPEQHKTKWRGHQRIIAIGPQGQQILKPFLGRDLQAFCFTPTESMAQRADGRTMQDLQPCYNKDSYRRAVKYAIAAARKAGLDIPDFHPHQLRHTAATLTRRAMGLDAARALLGHKKLAMTDDYAEIDKALAGEAARRLG